MPHHATGGETVLVAPRYLAGTTGTDPLAPLLDTTPDWTRTLVGPDPYYASPCQRLRAARRREGEWSFTYAADPLGIPVWSAHFDRATPDEVLTAFAEQLVDGLGNYFADHLHGGPRYSGLTPARLLAAHEWKPVHGSRPWHILAPDEHAAFHLRLGHLHDHEELRDRDAATWKFTAGPDPVKRPAWTASLTGSTPQPLLTTVAAAVADPRPVERPAHRVPERHRALIDLRPAACSARVAAAQARSTNRPAQPQPSAHEPSRPPATASTPRPAPKR
ncbi:DUF317 domain-containing protein [Streptomyces sp. NPDC048172]|uniref:DUF317 domain-containing protein n=1 Tax=Streptomyces sp. NPDC048172 TaxID=3365505 RepID=UPI00371830FC